MGRGFSIQLRRTGRRAVVCAAALFAGVLAAASVLADSAVPTRITSWNAYSKQFIDAPEFRLMAIPATAEYRAVVGQGSWSWTVRSQRPGVSLAAIWRRVAAKKFSLTLEWRDASGKVLASETSARVKAPDFRGFHEPAADWAAAADRNIAYLIDAASTISGVFAFAGRQGTLSTWKSVIIIEP
jgi:hypothetical protein